MTTDRTSPSSTMDDPHEQPPLVDQLPNRELAELAHSSNPALALVAFAQFLQREPVAGIELAHHLVLGHGSDRVRAMAALALGHSDHEISRKVLRRALDTTDPALLRRVAHALGRIGTPEDLPRLAAVQPPTPLPVGRDVLMARTLIGYRHGIADLLIQAPAMVNRLTGPREGIDFGGRVRGTKSRIVAGAAFEAPTLAVTNTSVQSFRCSGQPGGLAIDATLKAPDLRRSMDRPRLLGVLLRERPCQERFGLDAWLLADDRDGTGGTRPWLWLVRPDGTVVHAGRAEVGEDGAAFTITQSCAPYGRPLRVVGTLGGRQVKITDAHVGDYGPSATRPSSPAAARLAG